MNISRLSFSRKIKTYLSDGYGFFTMPILLVFFAILMSWITEINDFKEEQKLAISNAISSQTNIVRLISNSLYRQLEQGILVSHLSQRLLSQSNKEAQATVEGLLENGQGLTEIAVYDDSGKLHNTLGQSSGPSLFPSKLEPAVYKTKNNLALTLYTKKHNESILLISPETSHSSQD